MGLFQDQTSSLSEIKRLAALVTDPARRNEIGSDQWPLAMIAYGLVTCNEPGKEQEGIDIYRQFQTCCPAATRRKCALQLAAFIRQRKGDGWRALIPFVLADAESDIRRQAAFLIATLAAPTQDDRFTGVTGIVNLICSAPLPGQEDMPPALDALLGLADLRLAPCLTVIFKKLPAGQLTTLLAGMQPIPSVLGCDWLLDILDAKPTLAPAITAALCAMPSQAAEVMDVVVPIPSWQFTNSAVQALHSWTTAEYYHRMKERLARNLDPEAMEAVRQAWSCPPLY